jgi:hypothetical protein
MSNPTDLVAPSSSRFASREGAGALGFFLHDTQRSDAVVRELHGVPFGFRSKEAADAFAVHLDRELALSPPACPTCGGEMLLELSVHQGASEITCSSNPDHYSRSFSAFPA